MRVYVIVCIEDAFDDQGYNVGVFSTRELAKKRIEYLSDRFDDGSVYRIEEWDINED